MTEIVLSEEDRVAVMFKKLIDPDIKNIEQQLSNQLQYLSKEQNKVLFFVLAEGGEDYLERERVFLRECTLRQWGSLVERMSFYEFIDRP